MHRSTIWRMTGCVARKRCTLGLKSTMLQFDQRVYCKPVAKVKVEWVVLALRRETTEFEYLHNTNAT